ncbi:hypothetical protein PPYR_08604 [Photinus pyralis]|uniref:Active regulator of SIRT1 n=1 Tax=Photinus pyralis TaxID=7054 RepID=A0A1Y1KY75_PHOPY|nr:active regulator of SIRT1-like [Photinus pyralis]KAB0797611.1 hypothetical protein PPYR_08604 [Photinus pyralis]
MSAALVRESLEVVDADFNDKSKKSIKKSKKRKNDQTELFPTSKKISVSELRKNKRTKEQNLQENLEKLRLIREVCAIDLEENITNKIIERAVSRRPIKAKKVSKKAEKTAFTEEDFAKFEQEYLNE